MRAQVPHTVHAHRLHVCRGHIRPCHGFSKNFSDTENSAPKEKVDPWSFVGTVHFYTPKERFEDEGSFEAFLGSGNKAFIRYVL